MDESISNKTSTLPAVIDKSLTYTLPSNVQYAYFDFVAFSYSNSITLFIARGYASISTLAVSVPEPSTWAMMLIGFAGLGFAAYNPARKRVYDCTPLAPALERKRIGGIG